MYVYHYLSPVGSLTIASNGIALTGLWFDGQKHFGSTLSGEDGKKDLPVFGQTREWLDMYFQGKDPGFTPALYLGGTPFQKKVWEILLSISYGQTMTYGEIARQLAIQDSLSRMSAQAVGGAVGRNPISLIIPCHRVLGAKGSLTGYAGGIDKKERLLKLERGL